MGSLYEINNDIEMLLESDASVDETIIDESTGGFITIGELLDKLEMDQKTKFENIACYIKNLNADIEAIKLEEKTLANRRKVKENQVERLKAYLSEGLAFAGYDKFETSRCVLSFRKSKAIEISEGADIPKEYITTKVVETPDKKALMEALKCGELIDGVRIVENNNLQIK